MRCHALRHRILSCSIYKLLFCCLNIFAQLLVLFLSVTVIFKSFDPFGLLFRHFVGWHYLGLVDLCDLIAFGLIRKQKHRVVLDLLLAKMDILGLVLHRSRL